MRIIVLSHEDTVLTHIDNEAPKALHYFDDTLHTYLKGTAATFSFTTSAQHEDAQHLAAGNKVAFVYNNRDYYMNIVTVEQTETDLLVTAYGGTLELLNETCGAYTGSSMTFRQYFNAFVTDGSVELFDDAEISTKKISNEWTGEDTLLGRLFSLATVFDAEIELLPVLNINGSLKKYVCIVYRENSDTAQGIGNDRRDVILRYGKDVDTITRKCDITGLYTAIKPEGKDGLTIGSLAPRTVKDENNNVLYELKSDGVIYAPQARDKYPSNTGTDRYIKRAYSYQTDSKEMLYGQALAELKEKSVPAITYDIEGVVADADPGDTFTIQDEFFNPPLYISARVTEMEVSTTQPDKNKLKFSNVRVLRQTVSASLQEQFKKLAEESATYVLDVVSSAGTSVRDTEITTNLTAIVYKANKAQTAAELQAAGVTVKWYLNGDYVATGSTYTITGNTSERLSVSARLEVES